MTPDGAVQTVIAMIEAWNARDLNRLVSFMTPDVYWHDLGMPSPPAIGHAAVLRFCETALRAFPDFHLEIRGPICVAADGNSCVIPWTISATNTGPFDPPGFAPTAAHLRFDGSDYLVFRGGLISRIETRFDLIHVIEQMTGFKIRVARGSWRERFAVQLQRAFAPLLRRRNRQRRT
jgi:hypothetical protein